MPAKSSTRPGLWIPALLGLGFAGACGGAQPGLSDDGSIDESSFMLSLQDYRTSGAFTEVTTKPYPSTVATGSNLRVWISSFAASAYRTIDPDRTGAMVRLPEGTLIVREVYDAGGALKKLTLMGKDHRGYNPTVGDFWFAVTDPGGTPQVEDGVALTGRLEQCFSCHIARGEGEDWLFGVPAAARTVDPPPGTPPPVTPPGPPPPIDPGPVCGDFYCEPGESIATCPVDCQIIIDDHGGGDDGGGGGDGGGGEHGGKGKG